jgi:hypothetical protein
MIYRRPIHPATTRAKKKNQSQLSFISESVYVIACSNTYSYHMYKNNSTNAYKYHRADINTSREGVNHICINY